VELGIYEVDSKECQRQVPGKREIQSCLVTNQGQRKPIPAKKQEKAGTPPKGEQKKNSTPKMQKKNGNKQPKVAPKQGVDLGRKKSGATRLTKGRKGIKNKQQRLY